MGRGVYIFWSLSLAAAVFRVVGSLSVRAPDAGDCLKRQVAGTGIVYGDPAMSGTGQVLMISADRLLSLATSTRPCWTIGNRAASGQNGGGLLIRAKAKAYPKFSYGDSVAFSGRLSEPLNISGGDGRTFNYRGYLAKDGIYYEIKSAKVELATSGSPRGTAGSVRFWLFKAKRAFVASLERALGEPQAALAGGLVVGEKAGLGQSLLDDFRAVGLIHIVVLSGFNVTIVGVALRRALSFLPRVWGIIAGAAGIVLFGILVGGGATVVRSCFMAAVALVADLIRRDYNVGRALGFAALVMLIINPLILLHDPSFQLSFLATLGLILLATPVEKRLRWIPDRLGLRGTVAASFSTQIFVGPYILYMMGQISTIGIVANILVLPFIPATMLAVFATGAVGLVSSAASSAVGWISHLLLSYELFIVTKLARVPFAVLAVPPFSFWWVVGFYAAFAAACVVISKKPWNNSLR